MSQQLPKVRGISIFPTNSIDYDQPSEVDLVVTQPESMIAQLKQMKDYFNQAGQLYSEDIVDKIILATEDLKKILQSGLNEYEESSNDIFKKNFKTLSLLKLYKAHILNILHSHLYLLEQISKQRPDEKMKISGIQKNIVEGLRENDLLPAYLTSFIPGSESISKKVLKFNIPVKSKYELIMPNNNADFYPNLQPALDIRINNEPLVNASQVNEKNISFGNFDFDKGNYEISYNTILSPNLVPDMDKFFKFGYVESRDSDAVYLSTAQMGLAFLESPIQEVKGRDVYKVSFDAQLIKGTQAYIELLEDTEDFNNQEQYQEIKQSECSFHTCIPINSDSSNSTWQKYNFSTPAFNLATRKASIRILLASGEIMIRNFQVNKVFDEDIFLRNNLSESNQNPSGELINLKVQSPENYIGKIKITRPAVLFFKETFNPGWSLILSEKGKSYKVEKHFLGDLYGNAYFIERAGEFDFMLEFEPQRIVNKGLILSTVGWIVILVILIWSQKGKKYESN